MDKRIAIACLLYTSDVVLQEKAVPVNVEVTKTYCKHKLDKGYPMVWVSHQGKMYHVPVTNEFCNKAAVGSQVLLYYSSANDTVYLNEEGKYRLILVALACVAGSTWLLRKARRRGLVRITDPNQRK